MNSTPAKSSQLQSTLLRIAHSSKSEGTNIWKQAGCWQEGKGTEALNRARDFCSPKRVFSWNFLLPSSSFSNYLVYHYFPPTSLFHSSILRSWWIAGVNTFNTGKWKKDNGRAISSPLSNKTLRLNRLFLCLVIHLPLPISPLPGGKKP